MLAQILKRSFSKVNYTGLERWGIRNKNILYNLSVPELYEIGIRYPIAADFDTEFSCLTSTGALSSHSGTRYGRSPKDKRVVKNDLTKDEIWWGDVNIPISYETNQFCRDLAIKFINTRPRLFIIDGYAGWDKKYRKKIRIVCARPYHAIFMKNMLVRPTKEELA